MNPIICDFVGGGIWVGRPLNIKEFVANSEAVVVTNKYGVQATHSMSGAAFVEAEDTGLFVPGNFVAFLVFYVLIISPLFFLKQHVL